MAGKTNTEKIDEISRTVAEHSARLDIVDDAADKVFALYARVAVIEDRVTDLRNKSDESARRKWAVVPAVIGAAVVGTFFTLISQAVLRHFWP